ncbi:hypothetical protein PR048_012885 [Dryococelus australis]|uniref:Uncharacterized protein n=1 Tax=Dryococelus australis TaxID=614101 RepID=A0ABQ9HS35_9NEOP|nr:hypothetical protein PR048_012885 [Dryococelus australis]
MSDNNEPPQATLEAWSVPPFIMIASKLRRSKSVGAWPCLLGVELVMSHAWTVDAYLACRSAPGGKRGCGGQAVSPLASHQGQPGSIPGQVTGFSHALQESPNSPNISFRRCYIPTSITLICFPDLALKSSPNLFNHVTANYVQSQNHPFDVDVKRSGQGYPITPCLKISALKKCSPTHQDEPGSIPGQITPGFSQVEIVPDDAAGQRIYSGISHFPWSCISALRHSHLISPLSTVKSSIILVLIGYYALLSIHITHMHSLAFVLHPPLSSVFSADVLRCTRIFLITTNQSDKYHKNSLSSSYSSVYRRAWPRSRTFFICCIADENNYQKIFAHPLSIIRPAAKQRTGEWVCLEEKRVEVDGRPALLAGDEGTKYGGGHTPALSGGAMEEPKMAKDTSAPLVGWPPNYVDGEVKKTTKER